MFHMASFLIPGRKDLRFHAERVTALSVQKDGGLRLPSQALSLIMWGWSIDGDPTEGGSVCVGKGKTLVFETPQDTAPEPALTPEPTPEPVPAPTPEPTPEPVVEAAADELEHASEDLSSMSEEQLLAMSWD